LISSCHRVTSALLRCPRLHCFERVPQQRPKISNPNLSSSQRRIRQDHLALLHPNPKWGRSKPSHPTDPSAQLGPLGPTSPTGLRDVINCLTSEPWALREGSPDAKEHRDPAAEKCRNTPPCCLPQCLHFSFPSRPLWAASTQQTHRAYAHISRGIVRVSQDHRPLHPNPKSWRWETSHLTDPSAQLGPFGPTSPTFRPLRCWPCSLTGFSPRSP